MIRLLKMLIDYKAFVVAGILTLVLSSMVYSRIAILTDGAEIVLLSRPVDPRDLFRGHYVTMTYDINNLNSCKVDIKHDFVRGQLVFVQMEEGDKGYWKAVSVSPRPLVSTKTTIILSGYARSSFKAGESGRHCRRLRVRYGLEKYFAPKKRAKELENMRRAVDSGAGKEIEALRKRLRKNSVKLRAFYRQRRQSSDNVFSRPVADNEAMIRLQAQNRALAEQISALRNRGRAEVAVIVRVSKSGEGAIRGLMIDGKKVYDEPLL